MWRNLYMEHNILLLCQKRSLESREDLLIMAGRLGQTGEDGNLKHKHFCLLFLSQLAKGEGSVFPQCLRLPDD
jgi:hypothetical protein